MQRICERCGADKGSGSLSHVLPIVPSLSVTSRKAGASVPTCATPKFRTSRGATPLRKSEKRDGASRTWIPQMTRRPTLRSSNASPICWSISAGMSCWCPGPHVSLFPQSATRELDEAAHVPGEGGRRDAPASSAHFRVKGLPRCSVRASSTASKGTSLRFQSRNRNCRARL